MTNPPSKDNQSCLLKEARQRKGITLEMVHEATKIPLDALKSIEQGYSVHKLQTFYYRGFIKIYTKYLELDETEVLQEYSMLESAAPKPQKSSVREPKTSESVEASKKIAKDPVRPTVKKEGPSPAQTKTLIRIVILLVALFVGFKVFGFVASKIKSLPKAEKETKVSKPKEKEKPAAKNSRSSKQEAKAKAKESAPVEEKKETVTVSKSVAVAAANEASVAEKQEAPKPPLPEAKMDKKARPIEVTVRATKSGWLQVKSDGQVVFQSTLKKGAAETWKAESEIELSGRNINLLEFELNGKMLGALGASDRGAKKVVFTKDGLSVKK
ncbi:MAG: DUF4115 domain-containing protein [Candidatus Omnitrophica bacterium]|nr:DUF4115 domain-containing protein [Candidatus Omnitrophota bacterium]